MTEAGSTIISEAKRSGEWFKSASIRKTLIIPPYVKEALESNQKVLENFNNLAKSYKKQYIGWITSAKKEETRKRRLTEVIEILERNRKLGMKECSTG